MRKELNLAALGPMTVTGLTVLSQFSLLSLFSTSCGASDYIRIERLKRRYKNRNQWKLNHGRTQQCWSTRWREDFLMLKYGLWCCVKQNDRLALCSWHTKQPRNCKPSSHWDAQIRVKIRAKSNVQRKCSRVQIQSLSVSRAVFFHAARLIMKPTQRSREKMCSRTINRDWSWGHTGFISGVLCYKKGRFALRWILHWPSTWRVTEMTGPQTEIPVCEHMSRQANKPRVKPMRVAVKAGIVAALWLSDKPHKHSFQSQRTINALLCTHDRAAHCDQ